MKFNPDIHHRITKRLQNYDYSSEWLYFLTIAVKNKLCLFGEIKDDKLELFESGKMIEKLWLELENDFENIKLHDYVVMPNHFHGIVEITETKWCNCKICTNEKCRDTPCGYPNNWNTKEYPNTKDYTYNMQKNYFLIDEKDIDKNWISIKDTHKGCPYNRNLLWNIIWWFKSKTTHQYIKLVYENKTNPFYKKLWQKDFYEHIIRNEDWYLKIVKYIRNNTIKWEEDKFYYTEI